MTVLDNVAYGLKIKKVGKGERRKRAEEALELVQLHGVSKRKPAQLSGGQRQRVALARAIVNRPRVLLLDEPLGALDLKLRVEMQRELKSIQREVGITFVYVTHDQDEALSMSDRLAVFNDGKIEQVGHARRGLREPANVFVAGFVGVSTSWSGRAVHSPSGPRRSGCSATARPSTGCTSRRARCATPATPARRRGSRSTSSTVAR